MDCSWDYYEDYETIGSEEDLRAKQALIGFPEEIQLKMCWEMVVFAVGAEFTMKTGDNYVIRENLLVTTVDNKATVRSGFWHDQTKVNR